MKITRLNEEGINRIGSLMKITKYNKANDIEVYFPEYDWTAKHIEYGKFKKGQVKCPYEPRVYNIGCIGEGQYKAYKNNIVTKEYRAWKDMLKRCYDPKYQKKYPTYKDCTVCDNWLNFQNFAKWLNDNYYTVNEEAMCLDKDILIKGNKIYSPDTCIFVPENINLLFINNKVKRGECPIGVSYVRRNKKYQAKCCIGKHEKFLGYYSTPEEAFAAYKTFKEKYIKEIANQYKDLIPEKLYDAMYEYEIEWED